MKNKNKKLDYYMSLNYPFTCDEYEDDGEHRFGLQIPELPGVWAEGKTIEEAYANLVETKRLWFKTCLEKGIEIPEPVSEQDFSGRFVIRLNPQLHMALHKGARQAKMSLNQYVRSLLESQISNSDLISEIRTLGKRFGQLEQRMGSVEEAYSALAEVTATVNIAAWPPKPVPVGASLLLDQGGDVTYQK